MLAMMADTTEPLKNYLECHLDLTRGISDACDLSKRTAQDITVRRTVHWRIESIKHFGAELHLHFFPDPKITEERNIEIGHHIGTHDVQAQIAVGKLSRNRERRGVEPFLRCWIR